MYVHTLYQHILNELEQIFLKPSQIQQIQSILIVVHFIGLDHHLSLANRYELPQFYRFERRKWANNIRAQNIEHFEILKTNGNLDYDNNNDLPSIYDDKWVMLNHTAYYMWLFSEYLPFRCIQFIIFGYIISQHYAECNFECISELILIEYQSITSIRFF